MMVEKQALIKEEFLIDLTLHGFSSRLIEEFILSIVKPHFKGNMNQAIKSLIENAITEESLLNKALG